MRAPSYPLITVDPYFNVWSMGDELNKSTTRHWGEAIKPMEGIIIIDGTEYLFMGKRDDMKLINQVSVSFNICSTEYVFEGDGIRLSALFTTPFLPNDLDTLSNPISYLNVTVIPLDNKIHDIKIIIRVLDYIALNDILWPTKAEKVFINKSIDCAKVGTIEQNVLGRSGDNVCIDWGYFYLASDSEVNIQRDSLHYWLTASKEVSDSALFVFAYDDIKSIDYFGKQLNGYWKRNKSIEQVIDNAFKDYDNLIERCNKLNDNLKKEAISIGGVKYYELLALAYRQVFAAHKLVLDEEGNILYISKECLSGGLAATADVSYPSAPLFLIYCPELVKGMLRPLFKFANTELWTLPYAPHDAGMYPILRGQIYSGCNIPDRQMPIEECGNMLILMAAITVRENNTDFALENIELLTTWVNYLIEKGLYPENQLCTDDFAGFMANNCNLSLKSILGIASYGIICKYIKEYDKEKQYMDISREMATQWLQKAQNSIGSTSLSFDNMNTFSMKYNSVWDILFSLNLFPDSFYENEIKCYLEKMNPYGLPLDSREEYTKSDWHLWCALFTSCKEDFEYFITPIWDAYDKSTSRVPMTDWYSSITAIKCNFQHRTVLGGFWIKLLESHDLLKI